jgi:hypothetical protein
MELTPQGTVQIPEPGLLNISVVCAYVTDSNKDSIATLKTTSFPREILRVIYSVVLSYVAIN